jgi:NADP-dependent 3-hydroxy acid dehydrogenase YdfG
MRPDAVFFVTGAAHGIGAAFARLAIGRGAQLALADVDEASARALAGTLGVGAHAVALDVRDEGAWERALDEAWTRFGRVDVVVNNAGLLHGGNLLEQSAAQLRHMLDVNLLGVAYGLRAAVPRLARQGGGHIVDVASLAAYVPLKGQAFYSATKHAVRALHHAFALEQAGGPVSFTLVCPGAVDTAMLRQQVGADSNAVAFAGRALTAERVAEGLWRAAERRPRELLLPAAGGLGARLLGVCPALLARVTPRVERVGLAALRRRRARGSAALG